MIRRPPRSTLVSTLFPYTTLFRSRVQTAIVLNAVPRACSELVERPTGFGDADNRKVELAAFGERLQGGKYLLMGEIPRCPEKYQRIRLFLVHRTASFFAPFARPARFASRRSKCSAHRRTVGKGKDILSSNNPCFTLASLRLCTSHNWCSCSSCRLIWTSVENVPFYPIDCVLICYLPNRPGSL